MKIKKNDKVQVITGKDKGKTGAVVRVIPKENKVVVEGIALTKRHTKGRGGNVGRIGEFSRPINASNVKKV
jgi:large subunit ribosomal protein L24